MDNDKILPVIVGKFVGSKEKRPAAKSRLNAHIKYIEYRKMSQSETREDRYIFSSDSDHVQRNDVVTDIMDHTSYSALYHKIVLSPENYEHVGDYRKWTRDIMNDLQAYKGLTLHWYAVVQAHDRENVDVPHVHIVLAGAGEGEDGKKETVRMDVKDYAFMRQSGREHSDYEFYRDMKQEWLELDTDTFDTTIKDHEEEQTIDH